MVEVYYNKLGQGFFSYVVVKRKALSVSSKLQETGAELLVSVYFSLAAGLGNIWPF